MKKGIFTMAPLLLLLKLREETDPLALLLGNLW
jgi:hypothetical protein